MAQALVSGHALHGRKPGWGGGPVWIRRPGPIGSSASLAASDSPTTGRAALLAERPRGVVGASDERPGLDVSEAERSRGRAEFVELLGRQVPADREMARRGRK